MISNCYLKSNSKNNFCKGKSTRLDHLEHLGSLLNLKRRKQRWLSPLARKIRERF